MKIVFLETSALLRVVFSETGGRQVVSTLEKADHILASRLIQVETDRALIRKGIQDPGADALLKVKRAVNQFWSRVEFMEMTKEICATAGQVATASPLRSLDAIHLATFFHVRTLFPSVSLLSFDERILREV